uniref:Putative transporter n=1 Tax=Corethrella appendiculata TaxID=1370023 RepID=U5EUE2_9DIPT
MAMIKYDDNKLPYIDLGLDYRIQMETEEYDDELSLEKGKREIREYPDIVQNGFKQLRILLEAEKSLYIPVDEDAFLLKFLRPCKYYPDSTFELIKNYYKFKVKHKQYCENLLPETVSHVFVEGLAHLHPVRDQNGSRILILEVGRKWVPAKASLTDIFRAVQLLLEAAMNEPRTQLNGSIVVMDVDGLSLTHIAQLTPSFACLLLEWIQKCTAMRLKAIHIVNNSYLFNVAFAIFKPFLMEKLRKRIHIHNRNWNSLKAHIDEKYLWQKYGGTFDEIHDADGSVLAEFLNLHSKDAEREFFYCLINRKDV